MKPGRPACLANNCVLCCLVLLLLVPAVTPSTASSADMDASPYFGPFFVEGNSWSYRENSLTTSSVTVMGTTRIDSVLARIIRISGGAFSGHQDYFTDQETGYFLHGNFEPNMSIPGYGLFDVNVALSPPALMAETAFSAGDSVQSTGQAETQVVGVNTYNLDYDYETDFAGFERLDLPLGTFDAFKLQTQYAAEGLIEGSYEEFDSSNTMWLAPFVGMVKYVEGPEESPSNTRELSSTNVDLRSYGQYEYYIPYFANGSLGQKDHATGVAVRNCSTTSEAHVSVSVYSPSGQLVQLHTRILSPRGQDALLAGNSELGSQEGWILVNSDQPLAGLCFISVAGIYMADITLLPHLAATLCVPHVAQNATWDTYIFVCNPTGEGIDVTLTFVTSDGGTRIPQDYVIAANGSGVYALTDLLNAASYDGGSVIITADSGVAAFALYTNTESTPNFSYAGISAVDPELQ